MLSMIWAMDKNWLIGKNLEIPWHIPEDFKYFKKVTSRKTVIMGYKTFQSLGKPLPKRRNIVLDFVEHDIPNVEFATSLQAPLDMTKDEDEAFIIGGGSIYKQYLKNADRLYITHIDYEFDGNIYFPKFDLSEWKIIKETKGIKDDKNPYDYYFRVYERKK